MNSAQLDPRIGMLNSDKFYAFAHGAGMPETVGTLQEVEQALGIYKEHAPVAKEGSQPLVGWPIRALHEYIEALPDDVVAALPAMPCIDGDGLDVLQADLKTAIAV